MQYCIYTIMIEWNNIRHACQYMNSTIHVNKITMLIYCFLYHIIRNISIFQEFNKNLLRLLTILFMYMTECMVIAAASNSGFSLLPVTHIYHTKNYFCENWSFEFSKLKNIFSWFQNSFQIDNTIFRFRVIRIFVR